MTAKPNPGNTVNLLRDAHTHPIKASEAWLEFMGAMNALATDSVDERQARDGEKKRETDYARGVLGGHGGR